MSLQSAATTLGYVRQSPFVLTAPEVAAATEYLSRAARSGATLVGLPTLTVDEADHPSPQRLDADAQEEALAAALGTGGLSQTGLWAATVAATGATMGMIDLTGHPDFAVPFALEWSAINALLTEAGQRSERAVWIGRKPGTPAYVPHYAGIDVAAYTPGSGYTGGSSIDLDMGNALLQWLQGMILAAWSGGYTVRGKGPVLTSMPHNETLEASQGFYLVW